ncbi:MAG: hypothetical protein K940chlam2_00810 [Chlamydiae bacterium]|nr:hypothetical protein [Chlamydiota bacterium]
MTIPNLQRSLLDPSVVQVKNYQFMAHEHGVAHLVTAAKTEEATLKVVGSLLPNPDQLSTDCTTEANIKANGLFDLYNIGEKGKPKDDAINDPTRRAFIADHKALSTVAIISDNLTKLADGAEKEYFSKTSISGLWHSFCSLFGQSNTMKEIQDLRGLASRNLEEIKR